MNKQKLVQQVMLKTGMTKTLTEDAVNATFGAIADALVSGDKVTIMGFVSFSTATRQARKAVNPITQKIIQVPSKIRAKAKFSTVFQKKIEKLKP